MAFDVPKALALVEDDRGDGIASDGSDAAHGYEAASDEKPAGTGADHLTAVPDSDEGGEAGGKARSTRKPRKPAPVLSLARPAPPDEPDPSGSPAPAAPGGRGKPRSAKPRLTRVK
jgi:hypothetical protein